MKRTVLEHVKEHINDKNNRVFSDGAYETEIWNSVWPGYPDPVSYRAVRMGSTKRFRVADVLDGTALLNCEASIAGDFEINEITGIVLDVGDVVVGDELLVEAWPVRLKDIFYNVYWMMSRSAGKSQAYLSANGLTIDTRGAAAYLREMAQHELGAHS